MSATSYSYGLSCFGPAGSDNPAVTAEARGSLQACAGPRMGVMQDLSHSFKRSLLLPPGFESRLASYQGGVVLVYEGQILDRSYRARTYQTLLPQKG